MKVVPLSPVARCLCSPARRATLRSDTDAPIVVVKCVSVLSRSFTAGEPSAGSVWRWSLPAGEEELSKSQLQRDGRPPVTTRGDSEARGCLPEGGCSVLGLALCSVVYQAQEVPSPRAIAKSTVKQSLSSARLIE
ncbi:hypothetical protein AAFF_G00250810 [Aldrovandia affinis]|uniref:Uncharacterized protein n=1 Tax=Aldrovandia affinis TaxID=143900 RepID=A0AAD7RFJ2_9TELE|nr:hypothetical protein AAFF_G00250810 [Aldrovandia affinis]